MMINANAALNGLPRACLLPYQRASEPAQLLAAETSFIEDAAQR
jgi:hypothetical protein